MRPDEVEHGIFQIDMASEEVHFLGMGQRLAHESSIVLTGGQVVSLNIRGIDLRPTPVLVQNGFYLLQRPKHDMPFHLHHAPVFSTLDDLAVPQVRIHDPTWLLARAAGSTLGEGWLRRAVVGHERRSIGRQLVAGEERALPLGAVFESGDEGRRFFLAPLVAEVAHHPETADRCDGFPDPGVAQVRRVVGREVVLFFFTNVHSSSI